MGFTFFVVDRPVFHGMTRKPMTATILPRRPIQSAPLVPWVIVSATLICLFYFSANSILRSLPNKWNHMKVELVATLKQGTANTNKNTNTADDFSSDALANNSRIAQTDNLAKRIKDSTNHSSRGIRDFTDSRTEKELSSFKSTLSMTMLLSLPLSLPIIDVLSLGSQSRLDYLVAQQSTWASHSSIRHFFNVTEHDDRDPHCAMSMDKQDVRKRVLQCRKDFQNGFLRQYKYMPATWVVRKAHPMGWWCAQSRPGTGMGKLGTWYRKNSHKDLPDFLLLVDDDTMFHIPMLLHFMKGIDPAIPRVWAGCLTHLNSKPNRFSPFGGAGTIWSRGAVERSIHPIHCNPTTLVENTANSSFESHVCSRLEENIIMEYALWRDGMSISDLMYAVFNNHPNCFISDHLLGHFVNYYFLSTPSMQNDKDFKGMDGARFHLYYDALLFFPPAFLNRNNSGTTCTNSMTPNKCHQNAPVCHYMGPEEMHNVSLMWLS